MERYSNKRSLRHDIDEAILLADRILLMKNGPYARVAESVEITIPMTAQPDRDIAEHPNQYAIRNHLVQFLARSKEMASKPHRLTPIARQPFDR
jgi:nitrate/nitrite transport system ATP-binding protein